MTFESTVKELRSLLAQVSQDLDKSALGNKAASQRVRTGTVKLEKVAKRYRKDSISNEKRGATRSAASSSKSKRNPVKRASKAPASAASRASPRGKVAGKGAAATKGRAAPSKPAASRASKPAKASGAKRATAKLPARKARSAW